MGFLGGLKGFMNNQYSTWNNAILSVGTLSLIVTET